jgi:hypothetical protein
MPLRRFALAAPLALALCASMELCASREIGAFLERHAATELRASTNVGPRVALAATPAATPTSRPTPIPGATAAWSDKKLFRVSYVSAPTPVPMLAVHSWTLTIVDADEHPVDDATLVVLGGMPAHAHGLPTTPAVANLGAGRYRVDGLKFHMPGAWVVAFRIKAKAGIDSVSFALELP